MYVLGMVALIKKTEGEMVELKMLRFPLGMTRATKLEMSILEGQVKLSSSEAKLEIQD